MNRKQISTTPLNSTANALQSVDLSAGLAYEGHGFLPFSEFPRLAEELMLESADLASKGIHWALETWTQSKEGVPDQYWLKVSLKGQLPVMCQRCVTIYEENLDVVTEFLILPTQEDVDAYPLDEDSLDVLAMDSQFNALALIEDEALLSLPLMPKHPEGKCANDEEKPSKMTQNPSKVIKSEENAVEDKKPNPFLVLKNLKLNK
jgi:uncharacterized protein